MWRPRHEQVPTGRRNGRTEASRGTQLLLAAEQRKFAPGSGQRRWKKRRSIAPLPPVCRPHADDLLGARSQPATENAPARKHERMRAVIIDDCQLEIAVEGGIRDRLPLHGASRCPRPQHGRDSNQNLSENSGRKGLTYVIEFGRRPAGQSYSGELTFPKAMTKAIQQFSGDLEIGNQPFR
jgi:hypothetical protein